MRTWNPWRVVAGLLIPGGAGPAWLVVQLAFYGLVGLELWVWLKA